MGQMIDRKIADLEGKISKLQKTERQAEGVPVAQVVGPLTAKPPGPVESKFLKLARQLLAAGMDESEIRMMLDVALERIAGETSDVKVVGPAPRYDVSARLAHLTKKLAEGDVRGALLGLPKNMQQTLLDDWRSGGK